MLPRMRCPRLVVTTAVLLTSTFGHGTARADAVPPPPDRCPSGQVGVTSHAGPQCVPEAPQDCAPGYRGQVGGKCVLAICGNDDQCDDGQRCMQVDTCQEYRELHWTGWGWSAQRPVRSGNFFAEPPSPPPPGPPKKAWVELNICGQDGPCASPAECRPSALCYPIAAIGKTKAKVVEPAKTAPPRSSSDATEDDPAAPPPPNPPAERYVQTDDTNTPTADGGGCRKGCSTTPAAIDRTWLGAAAWVLSALVLRRRRRRSARPRTCPRV